MTEKRQKEILSQYMGNDIDDSIFNLSVQEIIFLYSGILEELKKNSTEELLEKKQTVFSDIIIRLMRSGTLYIAYHVVTGYPYIDVRGHAWIFSEKEYADNAAHHYRELGIPLKIKKLAGDEIMKEMFELCRIGIESLIVDNGQRSVIIYRKDILGENEPDRQEIFMCPELMHEIIAAGELMYASGGNHPSIPELNQKIKDMVIKSEFLVPVKLDKHIPDGEKIRIDEATPAEFALVSPFRPDQSFISVFTDWTEFQKLYSKDEWNAAFLGFDAIREAAKKANGFIIDPASVMYAVPNAPVSKQKDKRSEAHK